MKPNTKDLISAGILLSFALVGLLINGGLFGLGWEQHALGSARRMGPGYMPMLAFWILMGLGVAVLVLGLFNGPDPLEKWTPSEVIYLIAGAVGGTAAGIAASHMPGWIGAGWNPLGIGLFVGCMIPSIIESWRPLFLVSAAFTLFGLVLESLGFMVAITISVVLASFADKTHRPLGVAGLVLFLCALCWFVFIWYLDIRVPVWPELGR
ncbi:tripartite tricarboxylate transporter TctB family protein [Roseomonas alkaliterrae]|uniref:DUF1468 domain-containing protein n=1 Tax=Neoroseomonas alkaliterrae TaxID=1452450 RepID=A0A840XLH6_9PROT|nr:tripartite tricarboxylate transporter TctB family protein [Neoroseomonas alkaliterrae]MBB5688776.1 hypothetical protein [Neoroseomonas alkaliterrae]MBR0675127.1 tripartite tricarboxylate transporter TctB family protein [Neoroseomonas alkaliterrae]